MKNYSILALAVIILCAGSAAEGKYSGGTGEPNDPYRIATAQDLNDIGNYEEDWDKHFILVNDVNLAEYTGTQFNRIGMDWQKPFVGVFDGNDCKIWNFTWDSKGIDHVGLFRYVGGGGQIKNLGMENVNVNAGNGFYIGALVASSRGTVTNCYVAGNVAGGRFIGGLVGGNCRMRESTAGVINGCYSAGCVSGECAVGGLAGANGGTYMNLGTIINCYSTATVIGTDLNAGALVGTNQFGNITHCYSTGDVTGCWYVGGLVGSNNEGTITDCNSTGSVFGDNSVGGLTGANYFCCIITNCYSTGNVSAKAGHKTGVGGLAGWIDTVVWVTNCYATGNVSGNSYVGGLVGSSANSSVWGNSRVINCYSTGSIDGNDHIGGLVGENEDTIIIDCYSTGGVDGNDYVGGLIASNLGESRIINCYSMGRILGNTNVGGLMGQSIYYSWDCSGNECRRMYYEDGPDASFWDIETSGQATSAGGTGKTTAEMKTMSTFTNAGWDFVEIWGIGENQTYPFLLTDPAGDSNHDKKVDLIDLAILASHWLEGP